MGVKSNSSAVSGAAKRGLAALCVTALTAGSALAGTPLALNAQTAAGGGAATVWSGGGATEAPVVLAQSVYYTEEQLERMRNDAREERRYERRQEQTDYDNLRAGKIGPREYYERRPGGALHGKGYDESLSRGDRRCLRWSERCADNWGFRSRDYYGCMRYHGCR